jgi:hypothetical protein
MLSGSVNWSIARCSVLVAVLGAGSAADAQTLDFLPPVERYRLPSAELTNKLKRRVNFAGFSDCKLTLARALSALYQRYGLVFEVDLDAFHRAGFPGASIIEQPVALRPIPPMRDVPLATVLSTVLARIASTSGATFFVRPEAVEITTRRGAAVQGWLGIRLLVQDYARYPDCPDLAALPFCARRLFGFLSEVGYWHGIMVRNIKEVGAEAKARQAQVREGQAAREGGAAPGVGKRKLSRTDEK